MFIYVNGSMVRWDPTYITYDDLQRLAGFGRLPVLIHIQGARVQPVLPGQSVPVLPSMSFQVYTA